MDQHVMEGALACLLITGENHADDPEENDVIPRDQDIRRIEVVELGRLFRPAEG